MLALIVPPLPVSTLFPYTTLFRSDGVSAINGPFVANGNSLLRVIPSNGGFSLTIANGFVNNGAIELTSTCNCLAELTVTVGSQGDAGGGPMTSLKGGTIKQGRTLA